MKNYLIIPLILILAQLFVVEVALSQATLIADIAPGASFGNPDEYTSYNGKLYFSADDWTNGDELWSWNGISAQMEANIHPSSASNPLGFVIYDNKLFFSADDGSYGRELWSWDGSSAQLEADINTGSSGSSPGNLTVYDNKLYFSANDGSSGTELWSWDGSSAQLEADIISGSNSAFLGTDDFFVYSNKLYFSAGFLYHPNGNELWSWDGANAQQEADINPTGNSFPGDYIELNNKLYFTASDGTHGIEIWEWDGSNASLVGDLNSGSGDGAFKLFGYDNQLYFIGTNGSFAGLWAWDANNYNFKFNSQSSPTFNGIKGDFEILNTKLYFRAADMTNGEELWSWDGSNGVLEANINSSSSSQPSSLTAFNGKLFFSANDGNTGREVWSFTPGPNSFIWTGNTDTDWNEANNWNTTVPSTVADIIIPTGLSNYPEMEVNATVGNIEVEPGAIITIPSGFTLTVEGVLTNNGTITVESGGALVQGDTSTLAGSGTYNVERDISGPQTFVGSPINNQSVGGFGISPSGSNGGQVQPDASNPCNPDSVDPVSPYGNILELREDASPISNCGQSLWHVKSTGSLENGRGYVVNNGAATLAYSGTVNNGTLTYAGLTRQAGSIGTQDGSTSTRGWHLVSNPFPSPIELEGADLTAMGFDNQIHRYNPATGNWVSNDPLVTATIAVGQGFQIRKTSVGGSADFELDNSYRVSGNPSFYKQSNPRDTYLNISLDGNGQTDQSMVYFYEGATADFDPLYDANKLMGTYSNPMLYTQAAGERLSYNAFAPLIAGEQRTVPLSLHAGTDGNFTLSFEAISSLNDENITVTLEDLKLDTSIVLTEAYAYTFTAANSEVNERFLLHFNKAEEEEDVVNNIAQIDANGIALYPNPTEGNITLQLNQDHSYQTAVVYDITGKEKARLAISGQTDSYTIQTAGLSNGVYFLQLSGSESNSTLKFIKQ